MMLSSITVLTLVSVVMGAVEYENAKIILSNGSGTVTFNNSNGSIISITGDDKSKSILNSDEFGLWHIKLADGKTINAAEFNSSSADKSFKYSVNSQEDELHMVFKSPEVKVEINISIDSDGIGFKGEVTPYNGTILDFALPAQLRFDPQQLDQFICPMNGNMSVGTAFKGWFFQRQSPDNPTSWQHKVMGSQGYVNLFGGHIDIQEDEIPVKVNVTPEGEKWLDPELTKRINKSVAQVNRSSPYSHMDIVLVDSENGPYFAAGDLGDKGLLWRIGGRIDNRDKQNVKAVVTGVVEKLMSVSKENSPKFGLIALKNGPERGGYTNIKVDEWIKEFQNKSDIDMEIIASPKVMLEVLKSQKFLAILNPYGEWIPTSDENSIDDSVEAVGEYVKNGGNWFEVGGYSFFAALHPATYFQHSVLYPAAFADFFHLDTNTDSVSIYRIQPGKHDAWVGAEDHSVIFVPGRLSIGGDEKGGYCDRPFATYVPEGESWLCPEVRITTGKSAGESLRDYCETNLINRPLENKMSPEILEKFKNSVLVKYNGNCKDKIKYLDLLPVPTQVHFTDYLKGGFDKEYPDHLPPRSEFGTPEEFREFFDKCHELGHIVVPYTNPTWWCDDPKGPTFKREGEEPLLRNLDGSLSRERYGENEGYTICHWHPAVQSANRKTVKQFTHEYPVDILFQDQCGARSWHYDMNPASPTPYAYAEGIISMITEDSQVKPLSTESGWDRVVNYEVQLCGMAWSIVPTVGGPGWRSLMKYKFPKKTWEIFPLAQYIAHDKTAMLYHDLGQFVTNRQVLSWTLGLGFCMSYVIHAPALENTKAREWLRWLDRIQKSICSRYVGEPVKAFKHSWNDASTPEDDGIIKAVYGNIDVTANLNSKDRTEKGYELPPYGFYVTGPNLTAANIKKLGNMDFGHEGVSFIVENNKNTEIWLYEYPGKDVCVKSPGSESGDIYLILDDGSSIQAVAKDGIINFSIPERDDNIKYLWHFVIK
ncbi:hypothetical protein GF312_19500 [Candidatus Poribacteria bacterium]|nr:hypothetical protein [Candidatus Poribacteria bacterium]